MTNNDVLRKIRYTFDYSDNDMIKLFGQGDLEVNRAQISDWLKKEEDPEHINLVDKHLAHFLNGFIVEKRGKRDGPPMKAEKTINNNIILRKIKIALNLKVEEMIEIFDQQDFEISKHEISAFFRKPTQNQYRLCKDQFLRNFLMGMQKKYRPV